MNEVEEPEEEEEEGGPIIHKTSFFGTFILVELYITSTYVL
jgi:hypothetical protein